MQEELDSVKDRMRLEYIYQASGELASEGCQLICEEFKLIKEFIVKRQTQLSSNSSVGAKKDYGAKNFLFIMVLKRNFRTAKNQGILRYPERHIESEFLYFK